MKHIIEKEQYSRDKKIDGVIIYGPTGSGKSSLAVRLASKFSCEIVNADSVQIYNAMPIITAQPTEAEMSSVKHHLYSVMCVTEKCSAGLWLDKVIKTLDVISSMNKFPIIVGGTGMYINVLLDGLVNIPTITDVIKAETMELNERLGNQQFFDVLVKLDPSVADIINIGDTQRMQRAYAVFKATGKSITEWWSSGDYKKCDYNFFKIFLNPPKLQLHERCDLRFIDMLERDVISEVGDFCKRYQEHETPWMYKVVGVRELWSLIKGEMSYADMVHKIQLHTRHYAKQQLTWFRNKIYADLVIEEFDLDDRFSIVSKMFSTLI